MQSQHKIFFLLAVVVAVVLGFRFENTISFHSSDDLVAAQEFVPILSPESESQNRGSSISQPSQNLGEIGTTPTSILTKIQEAKQLLRRSAPLQHNSVRKQIALAILNKNTGEVFEKRIWVKEADLKAYKRVGTVNLESVIKNDPLMIRTSWWNSFNTPYEVVGHPEMVVLANKYLYPSLSVPYPQERSKNKYSEIIYSPYSEALRSSELVQAGKNHIEKMVDAAFESLNLRQVKSVSMPGKLVTEVVNKEFIKNIVVVEHVDPDAFKLAPDGGKILTERVLAIVGANEGYAYSYTGSPAGASGIAQFIKSTYDTTRRKYPSAGLVQNFNLGMADHTNAFKSMVLFFDYHKLEIENKVARKDVLRQLGGGVTEEMLALAYNGGPGRVVKSVNSYGLGWISSQLNFSQPAIFRKETLGYFNKFQAIKNLNIF